jgi:hypothetical protein
MLTIVCEVRTIVNEGQSRDKPLMARDRRLRLGYEGWMLGRASPRARRGIPVPQSSSWAAAASRSSPNMTSKVPVIPTCAGRLA